MHDSGKSAWLAYPLLLVGAVVFLFPLVWMVARSFMGLDDLYKVPPIVFPTKWEASAYDDIWTIRPFLSYIRNTVIVVACSVVGATVSSALCAYGFARLKFPLRGLIFGVVLATMMLPSAVTMIPVYVLFSKLHWTNTLMPLIVPTFFGGGAFNIFLLRQFFAGLPNDLDEAAKIDGANLWDIFWRIAMPLCKPALTVVAIGSFMNTWNDFMGPLLYLSKEKSFTLALGLYALSPGEAGGATINSITTAQLMAACSLAVIPVVLVFFFAQKKLISGTAVSTGIKG
ncbi:carbohydrate ABC transporter permease [Cohnella nanjingensis]|uniref:Carbohydrate ABC transporter permease n=1 Tax=Cohnella nanjingensis TaxID=1387779 RepID=A0A7X0VDI2_9BACL|nr:carbohydrate ABC transporter permease [Cohnella nanjingensis]MBB6670000.1 carbohydrate ABC transporter permease [Cohnella nanjingensis]